jgi:LPS-assembly protein
LIFCIVLLLLCLEASPSEAIVITSDSLEQFGAEDRFEASGNVRLEDDETALTADKAIFNRKTGEVEAKGHVTYEDVSALVNAEKAVIDLKTKTGSLFNAVILIKDWKKNRQEGKLRNWLNSDNTSKNHYWLKGNNIRKISEDHYYADVASFTACDVVEGESPDWCFRGRDVDINIGGGLTARDVTYSLGGLPVIYIPYIWAPVLTERQSGLLFPLAGHNTRKGYQFSPSYFWAIDDNKDATFYLDYYSKRGLGTGVEYRYVNPTDNDTWYGYRMPDRQLGKDFLQIKGVHDQKVDNLRNYVDLNYVSGSDFFKEYGKTTQETLQRYLQSSAEVSLPLGNTRTYLEAQYWKDLGNAGSDVPQRFPELGFVINPTRTGPFVLDLLSSAANFSSDSGATRVQRLDIRPTISASTGDGVMLYQAVSLGETAYFQRGTADASSNVHRETIKYRADASSRFIRSYGPLTHVLEPSVGYGYVAGAKDLPVLDATELLSNMSQAQVSLLSVLLGPGLSFSTRLTQPYGFTYDPGTNPLRPTKLEAALKGPFTFKFDMSHDFSERRTESVNSELGWKAFTGTTFTMGERYNRSDNITLYKAGIDSVLSDRWVLNSDIWYDAKLSEIREAVFKITYIEKCWALDAAISRKPGYAARPSEVGFVIFFRMKGMGGVHIL